MKDLPPSPAAERSRMQSILSSPQSDALIETGRSDVGFALEDEPSPTVLVSNPAPGEGRTSAAPAKKRILGMTVPQILLLVFMGLFELCVLVGFAALFYFTR